MTHRSINIPRVSGASSSGLSSSGSSSSGPSVTELVARSGDLKGELVHFAQGPRFERQLTAQLLEAADRHGGALDENMAVLIIDHFALQQRLSDGRTVVERFVAQRRPPLPEDEKAMVLGWRDVVEGSFEVQRRDGDALVVHNLVDDLVYQMYSNMGRGAFAELQPGMFVIGRIVPVHPALDAWLVSGHLAVYPGSAGPQLAQAVAAAVATVPELLFRNPEKLERAWELQAEDRADFIAYFGCDLVILPPDEAEYGMREYQRRRQEKLLEGLEGKAAERARSLALAPEQLFQLPDDLRSADTVAIVYDETEGLSFYGDYGHLDALFADPFLARDRDHAARLRAYLRDDSVSPSAIRRLVARHPAEVNRVFRAVLGKSQFSWERDGEALLRRRKKEFFEREPRPSVSPVGDRVAELLRAGR